MEETVEKGQKPKSNHLVLAILTVAFLLEFYALFALAENSRLERALEAKTQRLQEEYDRNSYLKEQNDYMEHQLLQVRSHGQGLVVVGAGDTFVDETALDYGDFDKLYYRETKLSGTWQDLQWELDVNPGDYVEISTVGAFSQLIAKVDRYDPGTFEFYTEKIVLADLSK